MPWHWCQSPVFNQSASFHEFDGARRDSAILSWTLRDPTPKPRPGGGQAAPTPREGVSDPLRTGRRSSPLLRVSCSFVVTFHSLFFFFFFFFLFCVGEVPVSPPYLVPVCLHVTFVGGPRSFGLFGCLFAWTVSCVLLSVHWRPFWVSGFFFFWFICLFICYFFLSPSFLLLFLPLPRRLLVSSVLSLSCSFQNVWDFYLSDIL